MRRFIWRSERGNQSHSSFAFFGFEAQIKTNKKQQDQIIIKLMKE
jgi:hypothetical protein